MTLGIENILLVGSLLLFISVVAGRTSYKFGVPILLLFVGVGMLAGSEGLGGIHFDDPQIAQFVGVISLNIILFSGGLETDAEAVRPILRQGLALSSIGVFLTAFALGAFIWAVTSFSLYESLLLASIVASTDAAAVFSILRSKSLSLDNNLRSTLELESGSNDPAAFILVLSFLTLARAPETDVLAIISLFLRQIIIGSLAGWLFAKVSRMVINAIRLDFEGLYFVLALALIFATFSTADLLGGNGFLAVYLCGALLGNQEFMHKKSIFKMFDGLTWLMQVVLFLTLGLLVFPSRVVSVIGFGIAISLFLIIVARTFAVFVTLAPFKNINWRQKAFVSWAGLRGAAPIVFATYPFLAGLEKADTLFNIVFFISLSSVLVQGSTLTFVGRWLGLASPDNVQPRPRFIDLLATEATKHSMEEIVLPENAFAVGKKIVDIGFPKNSIIAMIIRDKEYVTPGGSTKLEANDILVVLSESAESLKQAYRSLLSG